jgi:LPS sulfotransferase NodH
MIITATHLGKMYSYEKAESTALVINRTYGTAYTKHEVYHAEDVIELIRELHKADAEVKVEEE